MNMKVESIKKMVKNKVLLKGETGTGKTHCALMVSFLFSERGKRVCYVDPEWGCQKEITELVSSGAIGEEHLENIELYVTPKWKTGSVREVEEGVFIGGFVDVFERLDGDLVVVDSMSELMRIHKDYLEQKFIAQGYYVPRENKVMIKDPDTFTLPFQHYSKIYDDLVGMIYRLMAGRSHILCTMHPIGDTDSRKKVERDIDRKFDTIIECGVTVSDNKKQWYGIVKKNRGKDVLARIGGVDKKLVEMFEKVLE